MKNRTPEFLVLRLTAEQLAALMQLYGGEHSCVIFGQPDLNSTLVSFVKIPAREARFLVRLVRLFQLVFGSKPTSHQNPLGDFDLIQYHGVMRGKDSCRA